MTRGRVDLDDGSLFRHLVGTAGDGVSASTVPMLLTPSKWDKTRVLALPGAAGNFAEVPDVNLLDTRQAGFHNVPIGSPVNPEDRYEDWGYGGNTDDSTLGSDSPLLFRPQDLGTEQALRLTGESGNYAASPDVNLLPARVAHCEVLNGTANWFPERTLSNVQLVAAADAYFGDNVIQWEFNSGGAGNFNLIANILAADVGFSAGEDASASVWLRALDADTDFRLYLTAYDAAGTWLATANNPTPVTVGSSWTEVSATHFDLPASTAYVRPIISALAPYANGDRFQVSLASLNRGNAAAPALPSTRITGDIDIRANYTTDGAVDNVASQYLAGQHTRSGNGTGYTLYVLPNAGNARLEFGDGATGHLAATSTVAPSTVFGDGETGWLRATHDVSTNETKFYTSLDGATWTQLGATQTTLNVAPTPAGTGVFWGISTSIANSSFKGALHHAEVRDGIDGPIAAQFDADDLERSRTNLLAPDDALFVSGIGTWAAIGGSMTLTAAGGYLRTTATGAQTYAIVRAFASLVTPGETYSAAAHVKYTGTPTESPSNLRIRWVDASDTTISYSESSFATVGPSGLTKTVTAVAPANAVTAQIYFESPSSQTPATGESWELSNVVFREGADTTYVYPHGSGIDSVSGNVIAYYEPSTSQQYGSGIIGGSVSKGLLLPGSTGNYAEQPEVNLLDATQAGFHTGPAGFDSLELNPEDRYEDWGHSGGVDDTVLDVASPLLFRPQDVGSPRAIRYIGKYKNLSESQAINLLDAEAAHPFDRGYSGVPNWPAYNATTRVFSTEQTWGDFPESVKVTLNTTGGRRGAYAFATHGPSSTATKKFSAGAWVYAPAGMRIAVGIRYVEPNGAYLSEVDDGYVVATGGWQWFTVKNKPGTGSGTDPRATVQIVSDDTSGDFYIGAVMLVESAEPPEAFVPSLNLAHDFEVVTKASRDKWLSPASAGTLASQWDSSGDLGWAIQHKTDGTFAFFLSSDGTLTQSWVSGGLGLTDQQSTWLKFSVDMDNGSSQTAVSFYKSSDYDPVTRTGTWTLINTTNKAAYPRNASLTRLVVAGIGSGGHQQFWNGTVEHLECRDGIGGPTIFTFDPDEFSTSKENLIGYPALLSDMGEWTKSGGGWKMGYGRDGYQYVEFLSDGTASYAGISRASAEALRVPVKPGQAISASMELWTDAASADFWARIHFQFFDRDNAALSAPYRSAAVVQNGWIEVNSGANPVVAPANAHTVGMYYRLDYLAGTMPTGVTVRIVKPCVRYGDDGDWVAPYGSTISPEGHVIASATQGQSEARGGLISGPVSKALMMTGTQGNYAAIPDVNLLAAEYALPTTSVGWFAESGGAGGSTFSVEDYTSSRSSARVVATSTTAAEIGIQTNFPGRTPKVVPGKTYVASLEGVVTAGRGYLFALVWLDAAGAYISAAPNQIGTASGGVQHFFSTGVAPATAAYARIIFRRTATGGPAVGDTIKVWNVSIREGSDSTFVPSSRIVGDIDIRAHVQMKPDEWKAGGFNALVSKWEGTGNQRSYDLTMDTAGNLILQWSPDGIVTTPSVTSTAAVPFNGSDHGWVRATLDVDDGAGNHVVDFYTSPDGIGWTRLGTQVVTAGVTSIFPSSTSVAAGALNSGDLWPINGAVMYAEVRAGIHGPIVAKISAEDAMNSALDYETAVLELSPLVYYRMDDATVGATVAADRGSLGTAGVYSGSNVSPSPPLLFDDPATGLTTISQNTARFIRNASTDLNALTNFTINLWVMPWTNPSAGQYADLLEIDAGSTSEAILFRIDGNDKRYSLSIRRHSDLAYIHLADVGKSVVGRSAMLTLTWDGTTMTGYIDGESIGTHNSVPRLASLTTETVSLEVVGSGSVATHAAFSDLAVWDKALTEAQVARLAAIGKAKWVDGPSPITLQQGGDAAAQVIDRPCLNFTEDDEYLTVPNDTIANLGTSFSTAVAWRTSSPNSQDLLGTRLANTLYGFDVLTFPSGGTRLLTGDGTNNAQATSPTGPRGDRKFYGQLDAKTVQVWADDLTGTRDAEHNNPSLGAVNGGGDLHIGLDVNANFDGQIYWYAIFSRPLTSPERDDLDAWDGTVANEPNWLRDLAIFYINADDPWVADYYDGTLDTNRVLNLGAMAKNSLGWNIAGTYPADPDPSKVNSDIIHLTTANSHLSPTHGSRYLYAYPIVEEGDLQARWSGRITSDPVGPVTPGGVYTGSMDIGTNGTFWNSTLRLVWFDDSGEIARSDQAINLNTGTEKFGRFSVTGTAPTGATRVALQWDGDSTLQWLRWYGDRACIRPGVSGEWVPSARLTSDFDIRAHVQSKDWNAYAVLAGKWKAAGDERAYVLTMNTSQPRLQVSGAGDAGSILSFAATASVPFADHEEGWVRVSYEADDGGGNSVATFYTSPDGVDWSVLGTPVSASQTYPAATVSPVSFGAFPDGSAAFGGAFLYAEVRDGINGPIVAKFDADDLEAGNENLLDGPTAHVSGNKGTWASGIDSAGAAPLPDYGLVTVTDGGGTQVFRTGLVATDSASRVLPGEDYVASMDLRTEEASREARIRVKFYDSGNALVDTLNGGWVALTAGDWTTVEWADTAPATSSYIRFNVEYQDSVGPSNPPAGEYVALRRACFRQGVDSSFVAPNGSGVEPLTGSPVATYRTGDETAELVDRAVWMSAGSPSRLTIPMREELVFEGGSAFAVYGQNFRRSDVASPRMVDGGAYNTAGFYTLLMQSSVQYDKDGAGGIGGTTGALLAPIGQWNTVGMEKAESGDVTGYLNAVVNGSQTPTDPNVTLGGMQHTYVSIFGAEGSRGASQGMIAWVAIFSRVLTSGERTTLSDWDGTVASEPSWLRDLSILYINADDPYLARYYNGDLGTNRVLNLGAAIYGDFGWNIVNHPTDASPVDEQSMTLVTSDSSLLPSYGGKMLRLDTTSASNYGSIVSTPVGPITAGGVYTGSIDAAWGSAGDRLHVPYLVWYDADGEIGRDEASPQSSGDPSGFARIYVTAAAPEGATRVAMGVYATQATGGQLLYDRACIRPGTSSDWVPSMRIREDLDIRARAALKDWSNGAQTFVSRWVGSADVGGLEWRLVMYDAGNLALQTFGSDEVARNFATPSPLPAQDGEDAYVRITVDVDNGSVSTATFYTSDDEGESWTQLGSPITLTPFQFPFMGSGQNTVTRLGSSWGSVTDLAKGALFDVEVRDGIDGPVVMDFDADDLSADSENLLEPNYANVRWLTKLSGTADTEMQNKSGHPDDWYVVRGMTAQLTLRSYVRETVLTDNETYTASFDIRNDGETSGAVTIDWCDVTPASVFTVEPGETVRAYATAARATYTDTYRFADIILQMGSPDWSIRRACVKKGTDSTWTAPNGLGSTPEGQGVTAILSASGATAAVIARSTWLFTGSEYLEVSDRASLDRAKAVYVSTQTRSTDGARWASKRDILATEAGYELYRDSGTESVGYYYGEDAGNRKFNASGPSVSDGVIRVIGFEIDDDQILRRYLSGVERGSSSDVSEVTTVATTQPLAVGKGSNATNWITGFIDWVAVWDRALTEDERVELAAWDGTWETAPSCLEDSAVFLSADNPEQQRQWSDNAFPVLINSRTDDRHIRRKIIEVPEGYLSI